MPNVYVCETFIGFTTCNLYHKDEMQNKKVSVIFCFIHNFSLCFLQAINKMIHLYVNSYSFSYVFTDGFYNVIFKTQCLV